MTLITFQDGKPVMRDGKVGTEQSCCCGGCGRCIRNGEWDCQYTTQEECEDCTRTYTCSEIVQTECDGTCPEGYTPGDPLRVNVRPTNASCGWGYSFGGLWYIATVGCGHILSLAPEIPELAPSGFARLGRVAPTITATVTQTGGSASGAVLAVNLGTSTDSCGFPVWWIDSISVVSPGSGYTMYEPEGNAEITLTSAPGDFADYDYAVVYVSEVDEDGGIVSVYVSDYAYRWRESESVTPIVAALTVEIESGGYGSGAVLTPVIDTDTESATFGHITSVTVTNGGSGYRSLCSRARSVASCDDCPSRTSPEYSFCATYVADDGKPCGEWQAGFSCDEPPCCESCLVLPNPPYPPSPTRTCVPTLDAAEETSGYGKTSRISGPPPSWWGAIAWSEGWESEHAGCNLVWVEDYVQQTTATGTYCNDWSYQQIHPDLVGVYVPPAGCYMLGTNIWCPTYTIRFWVRKRLFLVDCRDRTLREVTDEALAVPIEWTGCNVPAKYECGGGFCWYTPLCDTGTGNYCLGSNPGFLNAQPTLECGE